MLGTVRRKQLLPCWYTSCRCLACTVYRECVA